MDKDQFSLLIAALDRTRFTEWTSTVVLTVSFIVGAVSLWYARRQLLADHKRSQRNLATEMCIKWTESLSPESNAVTRLLEEIGEVGCEAIKDLQPVSVPEKHAHLLLSIFPLRYPDFASNMSQLLAHGTYSLKAEHTLYIRYIAVRYLNTLESILSTWTQGIADQETIEAQFEYLFDETKKRSAMDTFRSKVGRDGFPSIEVFITFLRDKKSKKAEKTRRPPVV